MDDKAKKKLDSNFISMKEPYEVEYWTERLKASPDTLQEAIDNTGSHSRVVIEAYLIDHMKGM